MNELAAKDTLTPRWARASGTLPPDTLSERECVGLAVLAMCECAPKWGDVDRKRAAQVLRFWRRKLKALRKAELTPARS